MSLAFSKPTVAALMLSATMLAGCATYKPPEISYDQSVPPLPALPAAAIDPQLRLLHIPPAWTVARGGQIARAVTGSRNAESWDAASDAAR